MHRRQFLLGGTAAAFYGGFPRLSKAVDAKKPKLITVILEGGLDGLAAVQPFGDPDLLKRRPRLLTDKNLPLNPFFSLHPSMRSFYDLYRAGNAVIVHATAFPYTKRSHFEGQNLIQNGLAQPFAGETGWLGRVMDMTGASGRSATLNTPLILRGANKSESYFPAHLMDTRAPSPRLLRTLARHHEGASADALETLLERGSSALTIGMRSQTGRASFAARAADDLAFEVGLTMSEPDGPQIGLIKVDEFDTHANQGSSNGMLSRQLQVLDGVFRNLKAGLGTFWENSIVLTATEFGRTVSQNGSEGTDHGYGSVGLLAGGLIKDSRVIANWPGLRKTDLFEGRDLYSTLDYRAVCAACLEEAFGLDHDVVSTRIFFEPKLPYLKSHIFG